MKKSIAIILTVCIFLACTPAAFAAGAAVAVSSAAANPGDTIVITVSVSGSDAAKSMMIIPAYDGAKLTLKSVEWLLTGATMSDWDAAKSNAVIAYASEKDINGDVFKMTFTVKAGASGDAAVDCDVVIKNGSVVIPASVTAGKVIVAEPSTTIEPKANSGIVRHEPTGEKAYFKGVATETTVAELLAKFEDASYRVLDRDGNAVTSGVVGTGYRLQLLNGIDIADEVLIFVTGDADGDGKMDLKDAAHILRILAGWKLKNYDAASDFNGDGRVNAKDAVQVLRKIASWNVTIY